MTRLKVFTDGASRGNPGEAGIGVHIEDEQGTVLAEIAHYLGQTTNNVAEYSALIRGLEEAQLLQATHVDVFADSELMIKQMKGLYKVKSEGLIPLYQQAKKLAGQFPAITFTHVLRGKNKDADRLANEGIDNKDREPKKQSAPKAQPVVTPASEHFGPTEDNLFANVFPEARGTTGNNFQRDTKLSQQWIKQSEGEVRYRAKLAEGVYRETLAGGEKLETSKLQLKKDSSLTVANQVQEQSIYLLSGKVQLTLGTEKTILEKGESAIVLGGAQYEVLALEDTVQVITSLK